MSVKSDYLNKPLAQIALDQGFEISGFDESFYEDKTLDSERQYKIKVADYNKGELLSKAFGLALDSKFETALNLQSKKPLYALQDVTYWGTKDEPEELEITSAYDQNDLLPLELRENNKIICYNSDIDILKERNNSFLKYIILLTNSEETANSEYVAYLEKDIESITYIFETKKENGDKVYEMIKNKILNTDLVNNKYYKIYTITNKNIINWIEENGNAKKCLRSCNDQSIEGATSIKFKTEKSKKRVGLLINVQDFEKNIDVVQLQKKIIAVQSLKPKVEQLQKDISPEWVAKRLNFSEYGIASEDLTLKDGESYYWDTAQCWMVKTPQTLKKSDSRNERWPWEIKPFLRNGKSSDSELNKENIKNVYILENTDVIKFDNSVPSYSVNVSPEVIAKKAYAAIIHNENFLHSDFKTTINGREYPGLYYQSSQADGNKFDKDFIHESDKVQEKDKNSGCFYNCQSETPNNGLLVEAKEKIFDVYFLIKESATNSEEMQYDILDTLKNGFAKIEKDGESVKKYYYAAKIKKWNNDEFDDEFDKQIKLEKQLFSEELSFLKKYENELIAKGVITTKNITSEDIAKNDKYNYLKPGEYYVYTEDENLLTSEHNVSFTATINGKKLEKNFNKKFPKELAGCVYTPIIEEQEYLNPLLLMNKTEHFTYHEKNVFIKDREGKLLHPEYLLSFGYNQEKITTFKEWEFFKEKFAKFNKLAISSEVLRNNLREIPWWKQEGEYVFLNNAFIKIFFQSAEESGEKCVDLKPAKYDENNDFGLKFEITQEEIDIINTKVKKGMSTKEFSNNYIDSTVESIFDSFFEMVCEVWGNTDSKGIKRTKSYFLRDTPFEMATTQDMVEGKEKKLGFDARILLDTIIEKSFTDVYIKDVCEYVFKNLSDFFKKNKNINLAYNNEKMADSDKKVIEANISAMMSAVDKGMKEAIEASSYREFAEITDEIRERKKVAMTNAVAEAALENCLEVIGIGLGLALGIAASAVMIAHFSAIVTVTTVIMSVITAPAATIGALAPGAIGTGIAGGTGAVVGVSATLAAAAVVAIVVVAVIVAVIFIFKEYEKRNKSTLVSPDYVYKFTCRAKRALRQYSITKRGPVTGESHEITKSQTDEDNKEKKQEYEYGDAERKDCYYNWLAEPGCEMPEGAKAAWSVGTYQKKELIPKFPPFDGRVMVIIPTTDEIIEKSPDQMSGSILQNIEEFIQTWMGKRKTEEKIIQTELPISGYYDMFTGMHPWVEVKFRTGLGTCGRKKTLNGTVFYNEAGRPFLYKEGDNFYKPGFDELGHFSKEFSEVIKGEVASELAKSNFKTIDSTNYPYFTGMSIADNGVKKLKLELFDPNFASYTKGIITDNSTENVISLEALIRGAIRSPVFFQDEAIFKYESDGEGKMQNDYLAIDESLVVSPTNLKIRFGYDDFDSKKEENTGTFGTSIGRSGRWWNTDKWGNIGENFSLSKIKKYVVGDEIKNKSGVWIDTPFNSETKASKQDEESGKVYNETETADIAFVKHIKSFEQTTTKSRELDFMITGMSSELRPDGIKYTIDAIESKDATVMRTRFLQRYAEITANPEETLYILMHMFNEDNDGNNVSGSKVKIILISDDSDNDVPVMRDKLNMEYEIKNIKEEDLDGTEATNVYEKAYQDEELEIKEELLKKITLTLGGASATKNYGTSSEMYKPLYKTLAQLLNEFCSSCPPKKLIGKRELVVDENGNNVLSNQESTTARPLKWFSVEDTTNGIIYVCLYYRTVMKVPRIRVYTWGPNNPTTSCVKSISIRNANEFGVLAGIRAFDGSKNKCISRLNTTTTTKGVGRTETQIKKTDYTSDKVKGVADYIGVNSELYDNAYASSMYEGTMEILGDPFWSFEGIMQPCTYPIKLNVVMPKNDFTNKFEYFQEMEKREDLQSTKEEISKLKNTFGEKRTYNEGPGFDSKKCVETFSSPPKGNQLLHEMSGYYVVKTIEHNITPSDYTTRLGIISYPNIQKDVIDYGK